MDLCRVSEMSRAAIRQRKAAPISTHQLLLPLPSLPIVVLDAVPARESDR
ncbi:MAG: hypothetical protein ACP5PV_03980 [Methanothrix sp.]